MYIPSYVQYLPDNNKIQPCVYWFSSFPFTRSTWWWVWRTYWGPWSAGRYHLRWTDSYNTTTSPGSTSGWWVLYTCTVKSVLKDCPFGHKNMVSQGRWSSVTGSVEKWKLLLGIVICSPSVWSFMALVSQKMCSTVPQRCVPLYHNGTLQLKRQVPQYHITITVDLHFAATSDLRPPQNKKQLFSRTQTAFSMSGSFRNKTTSQ